jgi:hypothetical protein
MRSSDLARIKRLILLGQYRFTRKAELERLRDGLLQTDVLEAIISAPGIKKILRSTSPFIFLFQQNDRYENTYTQALSELW